MLPKIETFEQLLRELNIPQPKGYAVTYMEAIKVAEIGYRTGQTFLCHRRKSYASCIFWN